MADQFPDATKMVLSPAAQAIAWSQCPMREGFKCLPQPCPQCRKQGAAALRAAADQMKQMRCHGGRAWTAEQAAVYDALSNAADHFLSLATELENHQ